MRLCRRWSQKSKESRKILRRRIQSYLGSPTFISSYEYSGSFHKVELNIALIDGLVNTPNRDEYSWVHCMMNGVSVPQPGGRWFESNPCYHPPETCQARCLLMRKIRPFVLSLLTKSASISRVSPSTGKVLSRRCSLSWATAFSTLCPQFGQNLWLLPNLAPHFGQQSFTRAFRCSMVTVP